MIRIVLPLVALVLIGCGPSEKERMDIATITCNIISESRDMDGAMRIKEINTARKKLGTTMFLEKDTVIKEAFFYNLCKELVLNEPQFDSLLAAEREKYSRFLDSIKTEKQRVLDSLTQALDSIRMEKERQSKLKARKAKQLFQKDMLNWREKVEELVANIKTPINGRLGYYPDSKSLRLTYPCNAFEGLERITTISFKNGLGKIQNETTIGGCFNNEVRVLFNYEMTPQQISAIQKSNFLNEIIDKVTVEIVGVYQIEGLNKNDNYSELSEYFPNHYKYLTYTTKLEPSIKFDIKF